MAFSEKLNFKCDELAIALLRTEILPFAFRQNLDKTKSWQTNQFQCKQRILPKEFLPLKSCKTMLPKNAPKKNSAKKIPPKNSSKKSNYKKIPKNLKKIANNFSKNSKFLKIYNSLHRKPFRACWVQFPLVKFSTLKVS